MENLLTGLLSVEKGGRLPVYLQIAHQIAVLVRAGTLQPGYKLPSTRQLAAALQVHRRIIVQAYEELLAQGWLESHVGNGTFVARHLPGIQIRKPESELPEASNALTKAGFSFKTASHLNKPVLKSGTRLHLDDGFPDARLAPLEALSRAYRSQLLNGNPYVRLGYGDTKGSYWLRQEFSAYLNETRGLKTKPENILITRGVIMGVFLISTGLLQPGDHVVADAAGWHGANMNFVQAGAKVLHVPVDEFGMNVNALEELCKKQPIRLVYITSHHHYPTTVALRADRRIALMELSVKFGFIVLEDDYDYDFHYLSKPLLPLAGTDSAGMVLYCGSFTKTISPAFRVGYLVGPEDVIGHLAAYRRIIDRQGDQMLENAMAELLHNGIIQRHLRKSVRVYRQRRDLFCELMKIHLQDYTDFQVPDGGMAVWTRFDPGIDLVRLAEKALARDLYFANGAANALLGQPRNAVRLGFASSTPEELEESVRIIRNLL
ncbi:PLP-dependent aminotransferase family protein [Dyadobacter flavalbus]|uniref:PLP-dependent aminotransferase family protein n=1 Tax=Dyadobacter flavalbus TaxID=2579942 RepID=A0A5M8QLG0_9BACT|nr:PLP-dependent aminotransferase family protein [Dyadobacter flavalbus]KAA6436889.1 PLP-dependent aminotransferase family protein [Dyadobacter flavalbus]